MIENKIAPYGLKNHRFWSPHTISVHGIHPRDVIGCPHIKETLDHGFSYITIEYTMTNPIYIIGHGVGYDRSR